jgi:hypothetical protein
MVASMLGLWLQDIGMLVEDKRGLKTTFKI